MLTTKEQKIKELFDMVYQWGRAGIVVDFEGNAYRKTLNEVVRLIHDEEEKANK